MKDNNFLQIDKYYKNTLLQLGENENEQIKKIIEKDSKFLYDHKLIDYSLLIGIETCSEVDYVEP